jgi:hypothetical protein
MSSQHESVDCFNCAAVDRQCDKTRHRCLACFKDGQLCTGYPRNLQWLAGVRSRGKRKGQSLNIVASDREWQSRTPTNHTFVFKKGRARQRRKHAREHHHHASRTVHSSEEGASEPPLSAQSKLTKSPELLVASDSNFGPDEECIIEATDFVGEYRDSGLFNLAEIAEFAPGKTRSPTTQSSWDYTDGDTVSPLQVGSPSFPEAQGLVSQSSYWFEIPRLVIPLTSAWESSTLLTFCMHASFFVVRNYH